MHKFQCQIIGRLVAGSRVNPKFFGCFADESMIGHVSRATRKSHPGQAGKTTLARYLLKLEGMIRNIWRARCAVS